MKQTALAIALLIVFSVNAIAAPDSNPSWRMDNFVISNTGNVNIRQITWSLGFNCPSRSLGRGDSMSCVKNAAINLVMVSGVPTHGTLPTLVWMGSVTPPPPPPTAGCPGYLLGNAGTGYLTTNSGDPLVC